MEFKNPSGKPVEAHFYIVGGRAAFTGPERTFSHLVGNPGGTENAITVGSYDWNTDFALVPQLAPCLGSDGKQLKVMVGSLSCYSSPGPNRGASPGKKGATKPEIVAPGQYFSSPNARENGKTPNEYADVDKTGYYRLMNGTSAATPYTAGIVALMFQKKPLLTLGQVKELLISKASKTGLTPTAATLPNKDWGYGKLNLAAVDSILAAL
jgi:subtilisin family serine protease